MARYLMTHSLLAAWMWAISENPYEDATSERDPMAEFMSVLHREPTPATDAMMDGICFEDLVTHIVNGGGNPDQPWYAAAEQIADVVNGGALQCVAKRKTTVNGIDLLMYGRLDALRGGHIYDIKYSKRYDVGKYIDSTQHPMYMYLVPEAQDFTYLVSNGKDVWRETYDRESTPDILPTVAHFLDWLKINDLEQVYFEHWKAL